MAGPGVSQKPSGSAWDARPEHGTARLPGADRGGTAGPEAPGLQRCPPENTPALCLKRHRATTLHVTLQEVSGLLNLTDASPRTLAPRFPPWHWGVQPVLALGAALLRRHVAWTPAVSSRSWAPLHFLYCVHARGLKYCQRKPGAVSNPTSGTDRALFFLT